MKRYVKILLAFLIMFIPFSPAWAAEAPPYETSAGLLDDSAALSFWNSIDTQNAAAASYTPETTVLPGETLEVTLDAPAGEYCMAVRYKVSDSKLLDNLVSVKAGETAFVSVLPVIWKNAEGVIPVDRYENQLNPDTVKADGWVTQLLRDTASLDVKGKVIDFKGGETVVSLTPEVQGTVIDAVYLLKPEKLPDYAEYSRKNDNKEASGIIKLEAEHTRLKSDSFIRAKSVKDASMTPYDTYKKLLNVLDENSMRKAGQKALWEFEVSESGLYRLSFKYNRQSSGNMTCFRTLMIDGKIPFAELSAAAFPYHSSGGYQNLTLETPGGEPFLIYLKEGVHTLSLEVNGAPYQAVYDEIKGIMEEISALSMSVKKMVGSNSDRNRTWDVEDYLPDVKTRLHAIKARTEKVYGDLRAITGGDPTFANNLKFVSGAIDRLSRDVRTLPNKLSILSEGVGSVAQSLGDLLPVLENQPMGFDVIYFSGINESLPAPKAGFFKGIWESFKSFFYSFHPKMSNQNYTAGSAKGDELNVWVNRPVQYVEIMQQAADSSFAKQGGRKVNFSIMPNEQKLILANASGTNPDVALGISYVTPFDFAIRGAAKNLMDYEDFLPWYNSEFNLESLAPMCFDHGVYGVSETQDFLVLFYRKDILEKLGLSVPDTWEDVEDMMPVLLRNGMNFNIPVSNMLTFKNFSGTSPFIFQNNGNFYAATGDSSAVADDSFYDGMADLTDLYRITSLNSYVASFYNSFRYGQIPVGVSGFSTYLQLELAAPELAGKWAIAPAPGTKDADGTVHRYQMADGTAGMIFKNTKHERDAYELLKWWMGKDTQTDFAYALQSSFGPEFRFNTANVEAFKELPYPKEHREIILGQWKWQKEVSRHPAGYMVERSVSNVWNNVVVMNRSLRPELDNAALISDREISRKLSEFGYVDAEGNRIKDYPTDNLDYLRGLLKP